ncbi:unnamed protein product [Angiostrongylus costaricensis]|uniref:MARVEL domain-containing protein n=1 Tax=Angiostrongylus costaricensis TaxID=334426 RepID=A0A0R3PP04_ANGCS|nr:unnamed protein product [Angiostrongylus costaricensis]
MCIILGLILLFIALATPAWQVNFSAFHGAFFAFTVFCAWTQYFSFRLQVVYARELQQWLQSGLWMSCQTSTFYSLCLYHVDMYNITALICCGSNVAFIIFSYMVEYRFLQVSVSGIYEKHRGYSFYVALCGSLLYVVAFFFSLTYIIHILRKDRYLGGNVDLGRTMVGEM